MVGERGPWHDRLTDCLYIYSSLVRGGELVMTVAESLALDMLYSLSFEDKDELAHVVGAVLSVAFDQREWALVEELLFRVQSYIVRR